MVPAVAVNVAVALPAPTVTEGGTVNAGALLDRLTVAPPAGAAVFKEAVQVADPLELRDAGTQLNALIAVSGGVPDVTVPPTPLIASAEAATVAPSVFVTLIVVLATADAMVTLTTAATPFCIRLVFRPTSKHV
jgi:hypothetical protein